MLINYRPINLRPIFTKIFGKIIFTSRFEHFIENKIFTACQSVSLKGDPCPSKFLSIMHDTQNSFDGSPPIYIRGAFLDISKVFDKVWHRRRVYKLKWYGISGNLLKLIEIYLTARKQRVVLNGQTLYRERVLSGVPQESILGSLFFLIYINDLPDDIQSICKIFADETSLLSKCQDFKKFALRLNEDLTI